VLIPQRKTRFLENILLFTVFSAYFFPGVKLGSSFQLRVDDAIVLGLLPLLFTQRPKLYKSPIVTSLFLIISVMIISTLYGYLFLGVPQSSRDINEIVRLSKPLLLGVLLSRCDSEYLVRQTDRLMPFFSGLLIILGFIQYFNIAGIGGFIGSFYAPSHHIESMVGYSHRIVLTGSDPNIAAAIAMLFFIYNLIRATIVKKKSSIIASGLLLIVVLMTSSRTIFLALITILSIFLLTAKNVRFVYKVLLLIFILGIIITLYNKFQYLALGFSMALEGKNLSLLYRFDKWRIAWNSFLLSPLLGWGPAKAIMSTTVDGEYFLILRRFGLIGLISILISIFYMPFWGNRFKKSMPINLLIFDTVLKYYLIVIFFVMITNIFIGSYQLMLVYVFLSMIVYKGKKNVKNYSFNISSSKKRH